MLKSRRCLASGFIVFGVENFFHSAYDLSSSIERNSISLSPTSVSNCSLASLALICALRVRKPNNNVTNREEIAVVVCMAITVLLARV
jgi:hypothetical protein